MIVELKKVKITKSIFNQLLSPQLHALCRNTDYKILGWIYEKGKKYILLYRTDDNSLHKLLPITNMVVD